MKNAVRRDMAISVSSVVMMTPARYEVPELNILSG